MFTCTMPKHSSFLLEGSVAEFVHMTVTDRYLWYLATSGLPAEHPKSAMAVLDINRLLVS